MARATSYCSASTSRNSRSYRSDQMCRSSSARINCAVMPIAKIRMTTQIDVAGTSLRGTQEVLVLDADGNVQFTAIGGSHTMVRIAPEKPADFDNFLAMP